MDCWGNVIYLYTVYRPPSSPPEVLEKLYEHMSIHSKGKMLLVDHFHLPNIDWEFLLSNVCANTEISFDILFHHDLNQMVCKWTRKHGDSQSVLDLIFVEQSLETLQGQCRMGFV